MALDFTTNPGGLFPRIGRILHVAYLMETYENTIPAAFTAIEAQYQSSLQDVGGSVAIQANSLVRVASSVMGFASAAASATIVEMVLADQPSQSRSLPTAMAEVIRQMIAQGKTVQQNVITVTPTPLSGMIGNGAIVTTTKRGDGLVQENTVGESLRLVCSADSYTGGTQVGRERFTLGGSPGTAGTWDYDFPTGSNAATGTVAISADDDANTSGNLLTNGNMEAWTPTTPGPTDTLDNWVLTGTYGTDFKQDTTTPNRGTYAGRFIAGTGFNTALYQEFNNAVTGTSAAITALKSYAVNFWVRKVSGTITAGVLTIELVDGSGTVLNDQQGVANSTTITLSTLTTSYVAHNVTFRLNKTPPTIVRLRFRLSTPLTGADFVIDDICFAPFTQMYVGGPSFVIFSGATAFVNVNGDGWSIVNTNDQGGATFLATFQWGFQRLFNMNSMGLLLPSSGAPNISNALITA